MGDMMRALPCGRALDMSLSPMVTLPGLAELAEQAHPKTDVRVMPQLSPWMKLKIGRCTSTRRTRFSIVSQLVMIAVSCCGLSAFLKVLLL